MHIIEAAQRRLSPGFAVHLFDMTRPVQGKGMVYDGRIQERLAGLDLKTHRTPIYPLQVGLVHEGQVLAPHDLARRVIFREGDLERDIASEQLIGALAAEHDPQAILVNTPGQRRGAQAGAHHVGLEALNDRDDLADRRARIVADLEIDAAQVETRAISIVPRIDIVRRTRPPQEVARRLRPRLARVVGDQRAVDATTEQHRARQIAGQATAHRRREQPVQGHGIVVDRGRAWVGAGRPDPSEARLGQHVARGQLKDLAGFDRSQQRPDLRAEGETVAGLDDVERLFSKRIARGQEPLAGKVQRHEGVHAVQALKRPIAPKAERIGQDFGVRASPERHAAALELSPQGRVVIDLTVEGQEYAAVERQHRLDGVVAIDDAQAAGCHGRTGEGRDDRVADVAAMGETANQVANRGFGPIPPHGDGDAAHQSAGSHAVVALLPFVMRLWPIHAPPRPPKSATRAALVRMIGRFAALHRLRIGNSLDTSG